MWVYLKMGSDNMVLVGLLQIGAKDFTVMLCMYTFRRKTFSSVKIVPQDP